jgi:hypothetical protein
MRPDGGPARRRICAVIIGVAALVGPALLGTASGAALANGGAPGPSVAPDVSTTLIEPDGRSIALRQWFSASDAGTATQADRDFTWRAPSTTGSVDVVVFGGGGGGGGGKAGNHGNATAPNTRGGGGGGGGGGEVRRDTALTVTPGETLTARAGAGGAAGAGAGREDTGPYTPAPSGGPGSASWLQREGTDLLRSAGGGGGTGGDNPGVGGLGGTGGSGGTGGTVLSVGLAGVVGVPDSAPPGAAPGLDNSTAEWLFNGLRLGLGGGGGGGKSSNGGASDAIGPGTTATTAAVHDLTDLTSTRTRIAGDGDGGNNQYVSDLTKHAPARLGGGGGGGAYVFNSGRAAGRGGSGGVILHYVVADLIVSELTATRTTIPLITGSSDVTLQLRDAAGTATDISVGPISFAITGTDATLGTVTDNDDGTYTVTVTAGTTVGVATITATVVGADFADTALVTIFDPAADPDGDGPPNGDAGAAPSVVCTPDPVAPGGTITCDVAGGDPNIEILWRAAAGEDTGSVASAAVTLDGTGAGRFSFTLPRTQATGTLTIRLIGWGAATEIRVHPDGALATTDPRLPTTVRAGGGPVTALRSWLPLNLALLVAALPLGATALVRRRR